MKITFLSENCRVAQNETLGTEHGLSVLIEHNGVNILFDTGASDLFLRNAEAMGIDLRRTDYAVLSHGHHDHGGGLRYFLNFNPDAPVFLSELAFAKLYNTAGAEPRFIGLNPSLQDDFPDRFRPVKQFGEIADNTWIITKIPRHSPEPAGNRTLMVERDDSFTPDEFLHEIILCILSGERLFCFTGCSHNGILNMLDAVSQGFPAQKKVLISGFHMMNPRTGILEESEETVENVAEVIRDDQTVETVITCHCTGQEAFDILKRTLGEKLHYGATGAIFKFE